MSTVPILHIIIGGLREDYFITSSGEAHLHKLGGNALYAAIGARIWADPIGLVTRVGENYPQEWLADIRQHGFDTDGVRIIPGKQRTQTFYAYLNAEERVDTRPAEHFARLGLPLPAELQDYHSSTEGQDSRTEFGPLAVRPADLPTHYLSARGAHLAPYDYLTHATVPELLRREGVRVITCDPSVRYMPPSCAKEVDHVLTGLDAFLSSEQEARALFRDEVTDLWQAAEAFGAMGAAHVVIKLGARGQLLYDTAGKRRWQIPAYPVNIRDVTGAGDAFSGAFLTGLVETQDPVEAALRGAVSASIIIEGLGGLSALDVTPGLPRARLEALRGNVRRV